MVKSTSSVAREEAPRWVFAFPFSGRAKAKRNNRVTGHAVLSVLQKHAKCMEKARILVVEDESLIAEDIQERLRSSGYEVPAVALSGEEALQKEIGRASCRERVEIA